MSARPLAFGRRYAPDPRDRPFRMAEALGAPRALPGTRYWYAGPILDQGPTPQCVAYAWRKFLEAAPTTGTAWARLHEALPAPAAIYREAQQVDEWPGEDYEGTSVRAGVKVLAAHGLVAEYVWGYTLDEVRRYVLARGPVVVGTEFLAGMETPDAAGFLRLSGPSLGGHAYLLAGYSAPRRAFRMVNSWGAGWGQAGRAWIAERDLEYLLFALNGEACSAVERAS